MIKVKLHQGGYLDGRRYRPGDVVTIDPEHFTQGVMTQINDAGNPVGGEPPPVRPIQEVVRQKIKEGRVSRAEEVIGLSDAQVIKRRTEDTKKKVERELKQVNAKVKGSETEKVMSDSEREAAILQAVGGLDQTIDTHWTSVGSPRIKYLEAVLGFDITRDELNDVTGGNILRRTG